MNATNEATYTVSNASSSELRALATGTSVLAETARNELARRAAAEARLQAALRG